LGRPGPYSHGRHRAKSPRATDKVPDLVYQAPVKAGTPPILVPGTNHSPGTVPPGDPHTLIRPVPAALGTYVIPTAIFCHLSFILYLRASSRAVAIIYHCSNRPYSERGPAIPRQRPHTQIRQVTQRPPSYTHRLWLSRVVPSQSTCVRRTIFRQMVCVQFCKTPPLPT